MFADRLEVQSPGGLFGNVTEENLEEEHSTRNARLMRMLEDLHVVRTAAAASKPWCIVAFVRDNGAITNGQCQHLLKVDDSRAYYLLKKLSDAGRLTPARRKGA